MIFKFSKDKFLKNAPSNIKNKARYVLDDIENKVVDFSEDAKYGTLEFDLYGVGYELYPVLKEWCSTEEQLKLMNTL